MKNETPLDTFDILPANLYNFQQNDVFLFS